MSHCEPVCSKSLGSASRKTPSYHTADLDILLATMMYPYSRYILWRGILTFGPPRLPGMQGNFSGKMLRNWRSALPQNRPGQLLLRLHVTTCHSVCIAAFSIPFSMPGINDYNVYRYVHDYVLPNNDRCTSAVFLNRPSGHSTDRGNLLFLATLQGLRPSWRWICWQETSLLVCG